ncbi:MAG: hypothetical protein ACOH2C_22940, partial [Clostridium sp.]
FRVLIFLNLMVLVYHLQQKSSGGKVLKQLWTDYRKNMISLAGISIFMFGNKTDSNGKIVEANGMIEEFSIAKEQDSFIIPIATTGYVSRIIMDEIKNDLSKYWYLKESISILENEKDNDKIINEVIKIINRLRIDL